MRRLLEGPGVVRLAGAHNALGAKLAERAGFDGIWSSGFEISTSYAVPDASLLTMSEYLRVAQSMVEAVDIPVVADCNTGYGNSNNVIYMVRRFEAAGVTAVCMEDKQFPKVNSFVPGRQELARIEEFVGKIRAAKDHSGLGIIARVEALIAGRGRDEALKRSHAYADAGADAILIHNKTHSPHPIIDFVRAWDQYAPLVIVPTTYYDMMADEWESLGIKVIIYANQGIRAAIQAMQSVFVTILRSGTTASIESSIAPMDLVFELQGMPQMKRNEEIYLR